MLQSESFLPYQAWPNQSVTCWVGLIWESQGLVATWTGSYSKLVNDDGRSADAALAAVLSELDDVCSLKEQRMARKSFLYSQLGSARIQKTMQCRAVMHIKCRPFGTTRLAQLPGKKPDWPLLWFTSNHLPSFLFFFWKGINLSGINVIDLRNTTSGLWK